MLARYTSKSSVAQKIPLRDRAVSSVKADAGTSTMVDPCFLLFSAHDTRPVVLGTTVAVGILREPDVPVRVSDRSTDMSPHRFETAMTWVTLYSPLFEALSSASGSTTTKLRISCG